MEAPRARLRSMEFFREGARLGLRLGVRDSMRRGEVMAWMGRCCWSTSKSSMKEKEDWEGETRPLSLLVTLNSWEAGTGKSLAVGVWERSMGEMLPPRMGEYILVVGGRAGGGPIGGSGMEEMLNEKGKRG